MTCLSGLSIDDISIAFTNKDRVKIKEFSSKKLKIPSKCFDLVIESRDISFIEFITSLYDSEVFDIRHVLWCCNNNELNLLIWLHDNTQIHFKKEAMDCALKNNDIIIADWLLNNRLEGCSDYIINEVLPNKNIKVIKWLLERNCKTNLQTLLEACKTGNIEIINLILDYQNKNGNCDITFEHFKEIIKSKNLITIMQMSFKYNFKFTEEIRDICITHNAFDLLKLKFATKLSNIKQETIIEAYLKGYTELVKWVIKRTNIDYKLFDIAASKGDLEFIIWLHSKNFSATVNAMNGACINGHLLVVKFLSVKRTEGFSDDAVYGALREGHYDVYKWLFENYQKVSNNKHKYILFCKEHNIAYPEDN
jgi:hypothetical protein